MWAAGCFIAGAIIILWNQGENLDETKVLNNLEEGKNTRNTGDNIVNELLLSANELNIYGESSLIDNKYNDNKNSTVMLLDQIKSNPANAYQKILKTKLDKFKKQQTSTSDFNVLPVPK